MVKGGCALTAVRLRQSGLQLDKRKNQYVVLLDQRHEARCRLRALIRIPFHLIGFEPSCHAEDPGLEVLGGHVELKPKTPMSHFHT